LDIESELGYARYDQRRSARVTAIQKDMTLRSREEKRRYVVRADEVEVAGNPEWLYALLATVARDLLPLRKRNSEDGDNCGEQCHADVTPGGTLHITCGIALRR